MAAVEKLHVHIIQIGVYLDSNTCSNCFSPTLIKLIKYSITAMRLKRTSETNKKFFQNSKDVPVS